MTEPSHRTACFAEGHMDCGLKQINLGLYRISPYTKYTEFSMAKGKRRRISLPVRGAGYELAILSTSTRLS